MKKSHRVFFISTLRGSKILKRETVVRPKFSYCNQIRRGFNHPKGAFVCALTRTTSFKRIEANALNANARQTAPSFRVTVG
jgi:hypothetical protein